MCVLIMCVTWFTYKHKYKQKEKQKLQKEYLH